MNDRITAIISKLKDRNLKCPAQMTLFDDPISVRPVEHIAKRAMITAVVAKCAYDLYDADDVQATQREYAAIIDRLGLQDDLFIHERRVLYDDYEDSLCNSIAWQYEAANALLWALGMIDSIDDADCPDDVEQSLNETFATITAFGSFDIFANQCTLRRQEELADAFQLYWYYHWNIVDGMIFGTVPDSISYDVVYERRRALQWLLYAEESENGDWDFTMDT